MLKKLMMGLRGLGLVAHIGVGWAIVTLLFPFLGSIGRGRCVRWWSRRVLHLCRVQLRLPEKIIHSDTTMIVANHVSWLDIFVLNSLHPCQFVAKQEIRQWPIFGWISYQVGTVYITRSKRSDLRRIFSDVVERLQNGKRVAFFPEGSTSLQGQLLPFHANLFEAAIDAKAFVQPYGLRYLTAQGGYHPAVEYVGETNFKQSFWNVLQAETVHVELLVAPLIQSEGVARRELARQVQQAVAGALGLEATNPAAQTKVGED
jgi:1-acyl-sn-glycerol-3-phosphate acyltransferase